MSFALALAIATLSAASAHAKNPLVVFPPRPERLRAMRYAAMSSNGCKADLRARGIVFSSGPKVPTIDAPVKLEGPIRGVRFEFAHARTKGSKKDVLDCRLLLALDDMASVVFDRGIRAVRYNSMYRGRWARARGQRHAAGVAIDVVEFVKRDGETLNVLRDFQGQGIGSRTCGNDAPRTSSRKASELRELVCALDDAAIFNLMLSPHYDRHHKDHLHLEVRRSIRWFLTQ